MSESDHILFSAGGLSLACDSSAVHSIHESLNTQNEACTHDWFLGLAVTDERLLPVTDLGAYLDGDASHGRIIEVSRNIGIAGLKIDDVRGVSRQVPSVTDANEAGGQAIVDQVIVDQVIVDQGQAYHVIDIAKLLQSTRFLNVQHVTA